MPDRETRQVLQRADDAPVRERPSAWPFLWSVIPGVGLVQNAPPAPVAPPVKTVARNAAPRVVVVRGGKPAAARNAPRGKPKPSSAPELTGVLSTWWKGK